MNKELRTLFFLIFVALFFGGTIHNSLFIIQKVDAATNISSNLPDHWAWNDAIGWIDFYSTSNVNVTPSKISGYASSSIGYIAFDCAISPNGNVCGNPATWQISNDGAGNFSGWAWSDSIGWISFDCHNSGGNCAASNYQVTIDSSGVFSGWAWNDIVGWIDFNCGNDHDPGTPGTQDICFASNYKVKTSWLSASASGTLLSSTFDTGVPAGVAFNSIMWRGNQPAGTHVEFQFASANQPYGVGGTGPIDLAFRYAWNDSTGWWDFGTGNVNVTSTQLTGSGTNINLADISLDCATSPAGNICGTSNYKVSRASSTGDLSGYAWNDSIGWISFNCSDTPGLCATSNYKVAINLTTGVFNGWAWNDLVGWVSFNCSDYGVCGTSNYYVATNQTGFPNPIGPGGTSLITDTYQPTGPDVPVALNRSYHNNQRYYRYRIFLYSNLAQTLSPRVDEVIVNWSP